MAFPPVPVFPAAIDNDYTLFLVYNTTETRLIADNNPWSQEIRIIPVEADQAEIWPNNGFATIEGEMLYYDSVEKDVNGKVNKLKGCARNLAGDKTQFNKKGTWIRGFVVAEHHNQLVDAVVSTENFIGYNFDPRQETLDWRIRNLESLAVIFDDFACPDVNFTFNTEEIDPITGTLATYAVQVTPPNIFNAFRVDFGDGEFTTTELEGTHRYAVNASIDPVVTVTNDKCQIIVTPIERSDPQEPPAQIEVVFDIPIPEVPDFPDFNFVPCEVPEPDINIPPFVFPCINIEGQIGPIPSIIEGPDIPSQIIIIGPDINITESVISIISDLPSIIIIDPPIPPTIIIDPPIPPTIIILPPESSITLALNAQDLPRLEVDWGAPPAMEVALTMAQTIKTPERFAVDPEIVGEFGEEFADLFEASGTMRVEYEPVGIPSEIKIIPPDMSDLKLMMEGMIPEKISIDASEVKIPDIKIHGPDSPIPNSIRFDATELPEAIDLVYRGQEIPVKIETEVAVRVESNIPDRIFIDMPNPIPERIVVESNIPSEIVLSAPETILLEIPENAGIPLLLPDKMPEIEMIYKGAPIEVKITMDEILNQNSDGGNCVMIVPCNK